MNDLTWITDATQGIGIIQPKPDWASWLVFSIEEPYHAVRLDWEFAGHYDHGEITQDRLLINGQFEEREDFHSLAEVIHYGELDCEGKIVHQD